MSTPFSSRSTPFRGSLRSGSLRTQLIAWNIFALALLLGLFGLIIRYVVHSFLTNSINRELERQLHHTPPFRSGPGGPGSEGDRNNMPPGGPPMSFFFGGWDGFQGDHGPDGNRRGPRFPREDDPYHPRFVDLNGKALFSFDAKPIWDATGYRQALSGQEQFTQIVSDEISLQVLSAPIRDKGRIVGVGQAVYPLTDVNLAMAGLDAALLTLIPLGLIFAGMGGAYLTDRVLRRVRHTTQAAERISVNGSQGFSSRLPVMGNDEFSELAETFNGLLSRLESAFHQQERILDQQRRFTADASHELKTPLTVIKGTASMALNGQSSDKVYRRSLQEIDQAADTMSHLVQDLLLLARSDGGQLGNNRIELLLQEILERAVGGVIHNDISVQLRLEDESLTVLGNETEMIRLFSNLIDNAIRYSSPGGSVRITAKPEGNDVLIAVADTGIGIAPEHLAHLGERFYRVDASRARLDGGTGLGLSICKSIVDAHGGTLSIESTLGKGTTVSVRMPRPL